MDPIIPNIRIKTKQVIDAGETVIIDFSDWMITDLIICNHSSGQATLIARDDDGHQHIIASIHAHTTMNQSFYGGWRFWKGARLYLVKEAEDGLVNASMGIVKVHVHEYSIWVIK